MKGVVPLVLAVLVAPAAADPEVEVHAELDRDGGWLELDPVVASQLSILGASEDTEDIVVVAGRVSFQLGTSRWTPVDVPGRGWRVGGRLALDLGDGWELGAAASLEDLDTTLGRSRHVDLGLDVTKTTQRSRSMTTWTSFGLGTRRWVGTTPNGEHDSTQLMLTVGTTFR